MIVSQLKIVQEVRLIECGVYAHSTDWHRTRESIHRAVRGVDWPPGARTFTIYPQSGKKRGEGNGVKPIKLGLMKELARLGWAIEGSAKNALNQTLGDCDAVIETTDGLVDVPPLLSSVSV